MALSQLHNRLEQWHVFLWALVLKAMVFAPFMSTVLLDGTSNVSGTSSMLVIWDRWKLLSLLKTDNIKMKYQNLILTGCWKFLGKFRSCPHVQTSLHKVKAPFRGPWEIIDVFFSWNCFIFFSYILFETEISVRCFSRIRAFTSCSTSGYFGGFPHITFCPGIQKSFASCCLHNLVTLSGGGGRKYLSAGSVACFLAYLITFSLKLAVRENHFDIFQ